MRLSRLAFSSIWPNGLCSRQARWGLRFRIQMRRADSLTGSRGSRRLSEAPLQLDETGLGASTQSGLKADHSAEVVHPRVGLSAWWHYAKRRRRRRADELGAVTRIPTTPDCDMVAIALR